MELVYHRQSAPLFQDPHAKQVGDMQLEVTHYVLPTDFLLPASVYVRDRQGPRVLKCLIGGSVLWDTVVVYRNECGRCMESRYLVLAFICKGGLFNNTV